MVHNNQGRGPLTAADATNMTLLAPRRIWFFRLNSLGRSLRSSSNSPFKYVIAKTPKRRASKKSPTIHAVFVARTTSCCQALDQHTGGGETEGKKLESTYPVCIQSCGHGERNFGMNQYAEKT